MFVTCLWKRLVIQGHLSDIYLLSRFRENGLLILTFANCAPVNLDEKAVERRGKETVRGVSLSLGAFENLFL